MPKLIILGSSNAIADDRHENTQLAVVGNGRALLIDCCGNPIVRLRRAGLDFEDPTDLILTHFHPDHVSGVPLLLMDMWLLGRQRGLNVYGLEYTLERVRKMMDLYQWSRWPNFFPVRFHTLPEAELTPVMNDEEFRVFASPVRHLIPTLGLRIEFPRSEKALAYSCDTEPCEEVVRMAHGADVLLHEATGVSRGHTEAPQAGAIAQEAGVRSLYLIHYPTGDFDSAELIGQAAQNYLGEVRLAEDFMELEF